MANRTSIEWCRTYAEDGSFTDMSHPLVVNLRHEPFDVYIGRPGKGLDGPWGNPFKIGPDGTRGQVIALFERYLMGRPDLLRRLPELRGKRLGCFCAPAPCHGDVLARLANSGTWLEEAGQQSLFTAETTEVKPGA